MLTPVSYYRRFGMSMESYLQCSRFHCLPVQIQCIVPLVKINSISLESLGSTDLASGKPTSSSSVLGDLKPQLAVDSNPSPDSHKMSCFFSSFEDHPWWSVDLGHAVSVQSVTVTTRNKAGNRNFMHTSYDPIDYSHWGFVFQWLIWFIYQYFSVLLLDL